MLVGNERFNIEKKIKSSEKLTIRGWNSTHHAHLLSQKLSKKPPEVYRVYKAWNQGDYVKHC
jgi:hypothetical protein